MSTAIQSPGGYAASRAVAFADTDGSALLVSAAQPLPVSLSAAPAGPAIAGTAATSAVVGPFQPAQARAVIVALSGVWVGTVRLLRSTDGGLTKLPLTMGGGDWGAFTANCCEPVWEEHEAAARLYLDIALSQGTLDYRLSQ